jgi:hypothetical protein
MTITADLKALYEFPKKMMTYITDLQSYINEICEYLINHITTNDGDIEKIKAIIKGNPEKVHEKFLDQFTKTYAICSESKRVKNTQKLKDIMDTINKNIIERINIKILSKKKYSPSYIISHVSIWIIMMEAVILMKICHTVNIQNCWNVQYMINNILNIKYFNNCITNSRLDGYVHKYYLFEIYYLLQNEYFFTIEQLDKYNQIKTDMINNVPDNKLYQLMMGKGKTSVITPLLAYATVFLHKKTPTIITLSNLVEQTSKYIIGL